MSLTQMSAWNCHQETASHWVLAPGKTPRTGVWHQENASHWGLALT